MPDNALVQFYMQQRGIQDSPAMRRRVSESLYNNADALNSTMRAFNRSGPDGEKFYDSPGRQASLPAIDLTIADDDTSNMAAPVTRVDSEPLTEDMGGQRGPMPLPPRNPAGPFPGGGQQTQRTQQPEVGFPSNYLIEPMPGDGGGQPAPTTTPLQPAPGGDENGLGIYDILGMLGLLGTAAGAGYLANRGRGGSTPSPEPMAQREPTPRQQARNPRGPANAAAAVADAAEPAPKPAPSSRGGQMARGNPAPQQAAPAQQPQPKPQAAPKPVSGGQQAVDDTIARTEMTPAPQQQATPAPQSTPAPDNLSPAQRALVDEATSMDQPQSNTELQLTPAQQSELTQVIGQARDRAMAEAAAENLNPMDTEVRVNTAVQTAKYNWMRLSGITPPEPPMIPDFLLRTAPKAF